MVDVVDVVDDGCVLQTRDSCANPAVVSKTMEIYILFLI